MNAFRASDHVLLLCTADLQSLRNVSRSLPLLRGLAEDRPEDWILPVVNRFNPALPVSLGEVERTLGMKVYAKLHNDYRAIMDSINEGRPVVLGKKSKYGDDIRALASRLTGVKASEKSKAGLLAGILRRGRSG
jgi:Flp pilus assembly CpaE family ATPase